MGLDVCAFGQITLTHEPGSAAEDTDELVAWENPSFPGSAAGLVDGAQYSHAVYVDGPSLGYGRYSVWRDQLAKLAGYPLGVYESHGQESKSHCVACWGGEKGPFAEQINFSDAEGDIGPVVSAKLFLDYECFAPAAESVGGEFWAIYQRFRDCFEVAKDGGAVRFS